MNAATRGVILAVIAVGLGVFILGSGFDDPPDLVSAAVQEPSADTVVTADSEVETPLPATDDGETPPEDPVQQPAEDDGTPETPTATPAAGGPPDILHTPSEVRLLVVNGTDVGGAAGTVNNTFIASGYNGLEPANSDPPNSVTETKVYYVPGYVLDARQLAQALNAPAASVEPIPEDVPVAELSEAHVVIVLGSDLVPAG